jgi:hypothetical protein
MPARTPRRSFANPFVVTLAALPGCHVAVDPPPNVPPVEPVATATATAATAPVAPTAPPPGPPVAVEREQTWSVIKSGGACQAFLQVDCPKPQPGVLTPTCNPPAPVKYDCPAGLAEGGSVRVIQPAKQTECLKMPQVRCPPLATCNPPPPTKVACPGR